MNVLTGTQVSCVNTRPLPSLDFPGLFGLRSLDFSTSRRAQFGVQLWWEVPPWCDWDMWCHRLLQTGTEPRGDWSPDRRSCVWESVCRSLVTWSHRYQCTSSILQLSTKANKSTTSTPSTLYFLRFLISKASLVHGKCGLWGRFKDSAALTSKKRLRLFTSRDSGA